MFLASVSWVERWLAVDDDLWEGCDGVFGVTVLCTDEWIDAV